MAIATQLRPIYQFVIDVLGDLAVVIRDGHFDDEYHFHDECVETSKLIVSCIASYQGAWPGESTRLLEMGAELAVAVLADNRALSPIQPGLRHMLAQVALAGEVLPTTVPPTPQESARHQICLGVIRFANETVSDEDRAKLRARGH